MFTFINSAIRNFRASNAVRRHPDLSLLGQPDRDPTQERLARGIETRLFFDADLLASAQARQYLASGLKKSILACGAGVLLMVSPISGQAEEVDAKEPVPVEISAPEEKSDPAETSGGWLEDWIGLFDGEGDDPADGDP